MRIPCPHCGERGHEEFLYLGDAGARRPDGTAEGFFGCGKATTNCVFSGETLWVTNAGVLATGSEPSFGGTLARVRIPGGGGPTYYGAIRGGRS